MSTKNLTSSKLIRFFYFSKKIIDAKDDLSIQVHPDDAYALVHENGSFGKTECWYVLDAPVGAKIVIGHSAQSKKELSDMIMEEKWDQ